MFGSTERVRLLRESWPTASSLAEELFAMMSPDAPNGVTRAPLQINLPTGSQVAPIQIGNVPADGGFSMSIHHEDGSAGGSFNFVGGNITFTSPSGATTPVTSGGGGGGGGVPVWG